MSKFFHSNRVCIVITGASRGFGATLSTVFAQHYQNEYPVKSSTIATDIQSCSDLLTFVLIARNNDALKEISKQLQLIYDQIDLHTVVCDLSKIDSIKLIEQYLLDTKLLQKNYGHYILFHNAGSTGNSDQLCRHISVADHQNRDEYYRLNLYSVMELTGLFLRETDCYSSIASRHIINISSLAALVPFKGLSDYCIGKASREAYFRSLVHELEEDRTDGEKPIRILNYAPGPLETEMFDSLRQGKTTGEAFQKIIPLTTTESAEKLFELLSNDVYKNGDHVDFYDF